jgi:hypothetical protein
MDVEQVYRYAAPSRVVERDGRPAIDLSTSGGETAPARFFSGWVAQAAPAARGLLVVARTARSRFHTPPAMLARTAADPVVTADPSALRFESLSADCGVYARLDLDADALSGALVEAGTTNVDFNPPMREALTSVVSGGPLHLDVGPEAVAALTDHGAVVERRVPLPARWIKAFGEVHAVLPAMEERLDVPGPAVGQLLRALPPGGPSSIVVHVRRSGRGVRLSAQAGAGSVPLAGPARLALLDALVVDARRLRVFASSTGASAWLLDVPGGRFTLAVSPSPWRGFSGEGAVLRVLVHEEGAAQGARGLAGFDLASGTFFARRLPFDLDAAERLQPRLRDARRLVDAGAVRLLGDDRAAVRSGDLEYRVGLADGRCTCPWWAKHAGARGPCKHVLAAELAAVEHPVG